MGDILYGSPAVINELKQQNRLFGGACEQINLLNREIHALNARYIRAQRDNNVAFLYSLRLRLESLDGVIVLFLEFAQRKTDIIAKIEEKLREENRRVSSWN